MTRRCSSCGEMGHNSRTCSIITSQPQIGSHLYGGGGLRLFGVQVADLPNSCCHCLDIKFGMDCFPNFSSSSSSSLASSSSSSPRLYSNAENISNGYLSADGVVVTASWQQSQDTGKGLQWTEEEHKIFLLGLEKLGKGNWSGISRNFVTTRTPTQVASHAQKYFQQQNRLGKIRKRRPSLLDMGSGRLTAVCAKISKTRDGYSNPGCPETRRLDHSRFNSSKPARALDLELTLAAPTPLE